MHRSVELIIPRPHTQALRKPLKADVDNSPTLCVKDITPTLAFLVKFLRLRVFKTMGITPLYQYVLQRWHIATMRCKDTKNFNCRNCWCHIVVILYRICLYSARSNDSMPSSQEKCVPLQGNV